MAIFHLTEDSIVALKTTTFAAQGIKERQDLQRILRQHIQSVAPDTYVLAEEYGEWEDAKRRIDLLCIDRKANLVVVELKRTEDGGHMELQAIRYAAMVSKMTFPQAEEAHAAYLRQIGSTEDARSAILRFLDWEEVRENDFAQEVRILLVSGEFSKEITTSVMWLNEYDLDVRCVRLRPYTLDGHTLVDIQQVLPLQEASEYQVRFKKKAAEERQARESGSDWSRYDLHVGEQVFPGLLKRHLFFRVIQALIKKGITPEEMMKHFPERTFLTVSGECKAEDFRQRAATLKGSTGAPVDLQRFFVDDDSIFALSGKTYAVTKMWGISLMPALDALLEEHSKSGVWYEKTSE